MKPPYIREIRKDQKGIDDVAISCTMFRLERLDDKTWWAAAYDGDRKTDFLIYEEGGAIAVKVQDDGIGCDEKVSH